MYVGNGNAAFIELLQCMAKHGCLPQLPEDGACLAGEVDTVQTITQLEMVAGDWWVVRGVNCGQDDLWSGGYDWYPCQHERYLQLEDDTWINNTTYCGGTDSACSTDQIVTIPHATLPSPGLIRLDYDDEPLLPQVKSCNHNKGSYGINLTHTTHEPRATNKQAQNVPTFIDVIVHRWKSGT